MHAGRLVAHRHEPDAVRLELGQQRIDLRGRKAEEELDPLRLERTGEQLATGDFSHLHLHVQTHG